MNDAAASNLDTSAPASPIDPREPAIREAFDRLHDVLDQLERAMLLALPPSSPPTTVPLVRRDVMKPREYAEYMRVNVRKVHGWIRGGMPHFLVESRIRIRVSDADAWLESRDNPAVSNGAAAKPGKRRTTGTRKPVRGDDAEPSVGKAKEPKAKKREKVG